MFGFAQEWIYVILALAGFALEAYALIQAARFDDGQYRAAGKRTKGFWLTLTGAAAAIGFLTLPPPLGNAPLGPLSFLSLVAFVVAGVFLADVLPALRGTSRPTRQAQRGGW